MSADTNQASEDELGARLNTIIFARFYDIPDKQRSTIVKNLQAIIRTEKLKLLAEIGEPKLGDVVLMQPEQYKGGVIINDWYKNRINKLKESSIC